MAKDLKESGSSGSRNRMQKMVSKAAVTGAIPKSNSIHEDNVNLTLAQDKSLLRTMAEVMGEKKTRAHRRAGGMEPMSQQEAVDRNAYHSNASPQASYRYTKEKAEETMKPVSTGKKKRKRKTGRKI